jgi:peptidyl-prolyl cis-trans isomerase SurA
MKKIIFLIIIPFVIKAQTPDEKKAVEVKQAQAENSVNASEASKKESLKLIESYRQRVLKGESMSDMAKKYSEDPGSSQNGGRYDSIAIGMMVPEFEKVAFSLKPNEISKVFLTKYGYHFVQLIARKGDLIDFRHILVIPK